jgi:hypothetical protein
VANNLMNLLASKSLLNPDPDPDPAHTFCVSDFTDYFQIISKLFFEEQILLQKVDLW